MCGRTMFSRLVSVGGEAKQPEDDGDEWGGE
jgi:hypothetical protein